MLHPFSGWAVPEEDIKVLVSSLVQAGRPIPTLSEMVEKARPQMPRWWQELSQADRDAVLACGGQAAWESAIITEPRGIKETREEAVKRLSAFPSTPQEGLTALSR